MIRIGVVTAAVVAACVAAEPAAASSPGENGRIVFQSSRSGLEEIYSVRPDGTELRRLTWNTVNDLEPRLSPDGHHIAFSRVVGVNDLDIWIMNADGTDERPIATGAANDSAPVFTDDGESIVYQRSFGALGCPCGLELWIARVDGTGARRLETGPGFALNPDVSKQDKLAFVGIVDNRRSIYVTDLRGGPVKRVTDGSAFGDFRPRWSPRGNDLIFVRNENGTLAGVDVWRVHKDGSELQRLTNDVRLEEAPDWSPDGERVVFGARETTTPFGGWLTTIDAATGGDERRVPRFALPFEDAFDDGRIDAGFWFAGTTGTETSITETDRVEMTIGAGSVAGGPFNAIDTQQSFRCTAPGDFDVSVGYELVTWPRGAGVLVSLSAHFTGGTFIYRFGDLFGERYVGITPSLQASIPTTDRFGRLRLVRKDGIASAMVWETGSWRTLSSSASTGSATFAIQASSFPGVFGGKDVHVAFDDFRLEAGELICPPFWRDAAPDWAAG